MIKFSIHGSGIYMKGFRKDSPVLRTLKVYTAEELTRIIFDHDLFQKLNLKTVDDERVSSYHDLVPDENKILYCTDRFTVLEIKINGKRHGRIGFYELIRSDLLFPFVPVTHSEFQMEGINIIERDIGNFGSANLKDDKFDIQLLRFELIDFQGQIYTHKIIYNNVALEFRRTNTLNQGNFVINCHS